MSYQPAKFRDVPVRAAAVILLFLVACEAMAQLPGPVSGDARSSRDILESLEAITPGTHLIFKDPVSGKVRQFPAFSGDWLNDLRARAELQEQSLLYDLQNLDISGSVHGDFVDIEVTAQIMIRVPDEWVRVPLELTEFQLIDPPPEHSVVGSQPGQLRFEKEGLPRKSWLLRGEGIHQLKFHLIGAVGKDANGRKRIRLTALEANQSHLLLKLPGIVPTAELSTAKPMDVRTDEVLGLSEIETWGLSRATEITWAPEARTTNQPTTLQLSSPATMQLDLTTEPALLTVQQAVSIAGGTVDSLVVQLPEGFTNHEITATDAGAAAVVRSVDIALDGKVTIDFVAPMTGRVNVSYSMELARNTVDVGLRLPALQGVSNQTADVDLIVPLGLEVEFTLPEDGSVRQKRVEANSQQSDGGIRRAAYRLLSERAEMRLKISEPEAFYSVVPLVSFETEGNSVLLTARFSVNVVRGLFNEMTISWPDYQSDGWRILDGYTRLITDSGPTNLAPTSDADSVTVQFSTRQSRQFVIEMQALHNLAAFQASDGFLYLPDILTPTPHTTMISLAESDEHSMSVSLADKRTGFPQLPPSRWPEVLTKKQEHQQLTAWLVDSPEEAIHLDLQQQRSEIRAKVNVEVAIVNDMIHLSETLNYRVRHRDVREVKLSVGDVAPMVRLRGSEQPLPQLVSQDGIVTYSLGTAKRGEFDLLVDFSWLPKTDAGNGLNRQVDLPLVLPVSADDSIDSIEVGTNMPESIVLQRAEAWPRIHSDDYSAAWRTTSTPAFLPALLKHSLHAASGRKPRLLVARSALIGDNFMTATTAVFSAAPKIMMFSVPVGSDVFQASIGGHEAEIDFVAEDSKQRLVQVRSVRSSVPESPTATLVVRQSVADGLQLLGSLKPGIARPVGADQECNCIWVIRQASDRSVFHWSGSMSELTRPLRLLDSINPSSEKVESVVDLLTPVGDESRNTVLQLLSDSMAAPDQHQLLVGPILRNSQTLIVVSRRAMLLATAVIGLLMYFAISRLQSIALITVAVLATAAVTIVFAVIPGPAHAILIRFVPGCVIAVIAGAMQRWFSRTTVSPLRNMGMPDGSTIFTVDQPLPPSSSSI